MYLALCSRRWIDHLLSISTNSIQAKKKWNWQIIGAIVIYSFILRYFLDNVLGKSVVRHPFAANNILPCACVVHVKMHMVATLSSFLALFRVHQIYQGTCNMFLSSTLEWPCDVSTSSLVCAVKITMRQQSTTTIISQNEEKKEITQAWQDFCPKCGMLCHDIFYLMKSGF
jgi:hypothetical protein